MNPPSKDELKKKYGIINDDFDVLTESPSQETIWKRGWVEIVESISDVRTGLWRSWQGAVIAVIFFIISPPSAPADFLKPVAVFAATELLTYFSTKTPDPNPTGVVAFLPQNTGVLYQTGKLQFDQLPVGTGLFPASGQYKSV